MEFNKLWIVRLMWAAARARGWRRDSIYKFVWKLHSGLLDTKATEEDLLQEITNLARQNRKKDTDPFRSFFRIATSKRLDSLSVSKLDLPEGDVTALGRGGSITAEVFQPRRQHQDELCHSKAVEDAIKALQGKLPGAAP